MVTRGSKSQTVDTLPSNSDHQFHVQANDDNITQTPKMSLYEQSREQRIKENLQRMQQLGLKDLSNSLLNASFHPSSRRGRSSKGGKSAATPLAHSLSPSAPIRRSSRWADSSCPCFSISRLFFCRFFWIPFCLSRTVGEDTYKVLFFAKAVLI